MAALEIADRKSQIESSKKIKVIDHSKDEKSGLSKALDWITEKVDKILQNDNTDVYSSEGAKEALKDVMLLLIYLTSFNEEVIEETRNFKKLYIILADAVIQKKSLDIIGQVSLDCDK